MSADNKVHAHGKADNGGASIIQVESSKLLPWIMLTSILSGAAVALAAAAMTRATDATTAANQERVYVDELTQVMTQAGIKVPPRSK